MVISAPETGIPRPETLHAKSVDYWVSLCGDRARNGRGRQYAAFAPYSGTVRFLESAWWAREDSNLQPSGYERRNRAGKFSNNRYFCACSLTFVRV